MSCIQVAVTKVGEHLNARCTGAEHLQLGAHGIGEHLRVKCVKLCSVSEAKWLPLNSRDGYALISSDDKYLFAK